MLLTAFEKTLQRIDRFCQKNNLDYALIGGISVLIYQIPRTTQDIDITLLVEFDELQIVGKKIIAEFTAEKENPIEFFKKYYVLPVSDEQTNIHIDFSAGLSGFDRMVVERSKRKPFGDVDVSVCSLEDLIIYKLVAARSQDIVDTENLIQLHLNKIDKTYLEKIARQFTEVERDDVIKNLNNLFNKYSKKG